MKKRAQEAKEWVKPVESWESETREAASRRFFQVWNKTMGIGRGGSERSGSSILSEVPLKCTVWRSSVRNFETILNDLIMQEKEGLIDTYTRGLEEIYPELQAQANTNPQIEQILLSVNALLGKGVYEHQSLREELKQHLEQGKEKQRARERSPAEEVVKAFYSGLKAFPALQKKFLERVVDIKYVDLEGKLGKGSGGYYTGKSYAGGTMRPNRLLTFYLMKDSYPYLKARPTSNPDQIVKDYPNGNTPDSPIKGKAVLGAKKTFDRVSSYTLSGNIVIYVENEQNPDYDFMSIAQNEALKQTETKKKLQQKVMDLQKQSMFENAFLAKNVLEQSPGFEDKTIAPGISVLMLGREGEGFDINDDERDLTKKEDGGLFWVPKSGLPKQVEKAPQKEEKPTYRFKTESLPPSKNLFAHSLQEIFAQETADMSDLWVDDQGNMYDSMDDLLHEYENDAQQKGMSNAKEILEKIIEKDLTTGPKSPLPSFAPEIEPEIADALPPEGVEVPEEELVLAAKHIIKLVRIANQLDNKGCHREASMVDDAARYIIERLIKDVDQQP